MRNIFCPCYSSHIPLQKLLCKGYMQVMSPLSFCVFLLMGISKVFDVEKLLISPQMVFCNQYLFLRSETCALYDRTVTLNFESVSDPKYETDIVLYPQRT